MKSDDRFIFFPNKNKQKMLSRDQDRALKLFKQGKNVFLSGPGGCGKSFLIEKMYRHARQSRRNVQVCALTGCAAVLLQCGARTLHSFAGIGLGRDTKADLVKKVVKNSFKKRVWKEIDILIIDEVSMLSKKIFTVLDEIARIVRKSNKPFGGIQVVFSGDFYQLRPIGDESDPDTNAFCFENDVLWSDLFPSGHAVFLSQHFRQHENEYISILCQARRGTLDNQSIEKLEQRRCSHSQHQENAVKLFPIKSRVLRWNASMLEKLDGAEHVYTLSEHVDVSATQEQKYELDFLRQNVLCDDVLRLKAGAHVMCIVNLENGLVNGSQGKVVSFSTEGFPVVSFVDGTMCEMKPHTWVSEREPLVSLSQVPLILAWAVTIHKAQGATLEYVEVDVGMSIFEYGQAYVALSRVKSIKGLFLVNFDPEVFQANPLVDKFYASQFPTLS